MIPHLKGIDRDGGSEMEGYLGWIDGSEELREACVSRIARLPVAIEVESDEGLVGIIHEALWGFSTCLPVAGLHLLFRGHAIVPAPTRIGNLRFIDTGADEGGPLTVMPIA